MRHRERVCVCTSFFDSTPLCLAGESSALHHIWLWGLVAVSICTGWPQRAGEEDTVCLVGWPCLETRPLCFSHFPVLRGSPQPHLWLYVVLISSYRSMSHLSVFSSPSSTCSLVSPTPDFALGFIPDFSVTGIYLSPTWFLHHLEQVLEA